MVERTYLERLENVRILFMSDGADTFARQNDPEPDNIVDTQSKPIGQEGVAATQEPSWDSYQRVATNDTQRRKRFHIVVDLRPDETRPNINSLFLLVAVNVVKFFHRNEDALFGWIDLRNGNMATALDL